MALPTTTPNSALGDHPLVLVTVSHFFPDHGGGIELVAGRLVSEFANRGARVQWFASNTDPPPSSTNSRISHFAVDSSNVVETLTHMPYPLWSPRVIPALWRAIGNADLVHVHEHLYCGSLFALAIAALRRRPIVVTQHVGALMLGNAGLTLLYRVMTRILGKLVFRMVTHTVFISENVRRFFAVERQSNSLLIFNGIDTNQFTAPTMDERLVARETLKLPLDRKIVLFVGRFVRKKGLRIIERLAPQFPDILWVLVGSGPERPTSWQHPNVRVVGRIDHDKLPIFYRAADLLFLPSTGEGLPLVVQEALCCGLAVLSTTEVASACPPAAPLVRTCVHRHDHEPLAAWNDALGFVLADTRYLENRLERSRNARALWSLDQCVAGYLTLFFQLASQRRPRRCDADLR
ncbi:MAG: glycosyltransferase family 4 protein [Steroidobacteraceae bacterium]